MGFYDELYCEAELPDTDVPPGACFRTRAFPGPLIFQYRITKDGRLLDALGRDLECDGFLEFYYYLDPSAHLGPRGLFAPIIGRISWRNPNQAIKVGVGCNGGRPWRASATHFRSVRLETA